MDSALNVSKIPDELSSRNDNDQEMEYIEFDDGQLGENEYEDETSQDSDRGKRQIRFYVKNGHKVPAKNWHNVKPLKNVNLPQFSYNPNLQNPRFQPIYDNNYDSRNRQKPYHTNNNFFTFDNSFSQYLSENTQTLRPFKASISDLSQQRFPQHNVATQIITKSPPISSLVNNQNLYSTLAGGFYNNAVKGNDNRNNNNLYSQTLSPLDSSILSSSIVTGKPQITSTMRVLSNFAKNLANIDHPSSKPINNNVNNKPKEVFKEQDYDDEDSNENEENSSEEEDDQDFSQNFQPDISNLPYGYTHPSNKYANIQNPFANPNFNFDSFIAKLQESHNSVIGVTTLKPITQSKHFNSMNNNKNEQMNPENGAHPSTSKYRIISSPKPFTVPVGLNKESQVQGNTNLVQKQLQFSQQNKNIQQIQEQNYYKPSQKDAGIPLETFKPKLQPPNFNDDRQIPLSHSFNNAVKGNHQPTRTSQLSQQLNTVTQKPYVILSGTGSPYTFSTPNNYNVVTLQPALMSSRKPYISSTVSPTNALILTFSQSTPKPISAIVNQHLSTLQQFWKNPSTEISIPKVPINRPNAVSEIPKLSDLFSQPVHISTENPLHERTTTKDPPKRKPIPKPSPEMNDYYYDDEDEQYYYEPVVKPKYMPSSEIKPQRPPMAQNYQEYEDSEEVTNLSSVSNSEKPAKYNLFKQEAVTKNPNDVSVVTKTPYKQSNKNVQRKIPVPVMINYSTLSNSIPMRPDVSSYQVVHNNPRNKTIHIRKPIHFDNPNTLRPPKYLNQTTLRPYTIRHRLAKPTTEKNINDFNEETKKNRGRVRHHNIVAQMKLTTPRDSFNQETRYTKTNHDDKTNR